MNCADWYVYILECRNGHFYVGITTDVSKRLIRHNAGKGAKYTRSFRPVKLVYTEKMMSESDARKREAEIKKWKREKKKELVRN